MVKVSSRDDDQEFFKVFMPTHSSHNMLIPPVFVRKFIRSTPKNAVLKDETGGSWHVGVKKVESRMYFTMGWEAFVNGNSLEFGDFLMFKRVTDSSFEVTIYAGNGCKKSQLPNYGHKKSTEEKKSESDDKTEVKLVKENPMIKSQLTDFGRQKSTNEKQGFADSSSKESEDKTLVKRVTKALKIKKNVGRKKSTKEKSESEDKPKAKLVEKNLKRKRDARTNEFVGITSAIPNRGHAQSLRNKSATENPRFVRTLTAKRYSRYSLFFPSSVLEGIGLGEKLVLRCENNKVWPVGTLVRRDGRCMIGSGWAQFVKGNKLKADDKCLFELVVDETSTCREIRVQIIHRAA